MNEMPTGALGKSGYSVYNAGLFMLDSYYPVREELRPAYQQDEGLWMKWVEEKAVRQLWTDLLQSHGMWS